MSGYKDPRDFRFVVDFTEIKKRVNHDAARFIAMRLAATCLKNVNVLVYSPEALKWVDLGTYTPKGYMIDSFGTVNTINKEGNGLDHFGKYGCYYSKEEVKAMAKSYGPMVISAATNKIEFDNGVVFVYDFHAKGYKLNQGARPSYSKGYDVIYEEEGGQS